MTATRDRRATRWDAHRRARRGAIVDAALVAIRQHGAGVGMDDVAGAAGTSKTVVYRHFTDRAELYAAICARVAGVLVEHVRSAIDAVTEPREKAAAAIAAYLRLIEHDPEVYRFVAHRPLADPDGAADPVTDLVTLVGDQIADAMTEQLAAADGDTSGAVPWSHGIVGLVRGAADNWLSRPAGMSRDELAKHLTDLVWGGLAGVMRRKAPD